MVVVGTIIITFFSKKKKKLTKLHLLRLSFAEMRFIEVKLYLTLIRNGKTINS